MDNQPKVTSVLFAILYYAICIGIVLGVCYLFVLSIFKMMGVL
jgi:hypothetical protein